MARSDHPPRILVTGATGKTGHAVVAQLLEKGWPVRAVVRPGSHGGHRLERLGAEVVIADLFDFDQMLVAMRGTRRAYFCPPFHPFMIQAAMVFVAAAHEVGLEAVVGLSQWTSSVNHPSLQTRQQWLVDRMLAAIPGIIHVNLNPGYFADNYLRMIDFATLLGVFPILTGNSRNAPPSNEDIARVAVAILMDPEPHQGRSYRPTGPRLVSAYDMAKVVEKVLRSPILPVSLPLWMFFRAARLQGVSAFQLSNLRTYIEDHRQGAFEYGAPTDIVPMLTGQPAEDLETTVRRYVARPFAQRTLGNRLRALTQFALVPFVPGYDLRHHELNHGYPRPTGPEFVMASARWRAEHSAG